MLVDFWPRPCLEKTKRFSVLVLVRVCPTTLNDEDLQASDMNVKSSVCAAFMTPVSCISRADSVTCFVFKDMQGAGRTAPCQPALPCGCGGCAGGHLA